MRNIQYRKLVSYLVLAASFIFIFSLLVTSSSDVEVEKVSIVDRPLTSVSKHVKEKLRKPTESDGRADAALIMLVR